MIENDKGISIYICCEDEKIKQVMAAEILGYFGRQGINIRIEGKALEDFFEFIKSQNQKQLLREIKDIEIPLDVFNPVFGKERIQEILDSESKDSNPPVVLKRIHWGNNVLSEDINPISTYLVKVNEDWYTGHFRLSEPQNYWEFEEIQRRCIESRKRYALSYESTTKTGIREIYEIVRGGPANNPARK